MDTGLPHKNNNNNKSPDQHALTPYSCYISHFFSFFSRTLMNPLTLKSINLKNIYLFWVERSLQKNNLQKSSGNHDFFYFSLTFHHLSQDFFLLLAVRDYLKHLPQWHVWQMRESYHLTSEYVIRLQLYSMLAMFLEIFWTKERWKQSKQEVLQQTVR